jgi:CrcB protein
MTVLYVLCGGAAGAALRYLASWALRWSTFAVNVAGSLLMGVLAGVTAAHPGLPGWVRALVGVGFCGALTTYSTFALEAVSLTRRSWAYASINVGATLVVGIGAASIGWWVGSSAF